MTSRAAIAAVHEARLDAWAATLHDQVLQPLYALRFAARLAPDEHDERIGAIAATVHRLVAAMAPPVLADFGLASALRALAPTAEVRLDGADEADLPAPTARYLYRVAQDALAQVPCPVSVRVSISACDASIQIDGLPPHDAPSAPPRAVESLAVHGPA